LLFNTLTGSISEDAAPACIMSRGNRATGKATDWDGATIKAVSDLKDASGQFKWLSGRGGV